NSSFDAPTESSSLSATVGGEATRAVVQDVHSLLFALLPANPGLFSCRPRNRHHDQKSRRPLSTGPAASPLARRIWPTADYYGINRPIRPDNRVSSTGSLNQMLLSGPTVIPIGALLGVMPQV